MPVSVNLYTRKTLVFTHIGLAAKTTMQIRGMASAKQHTFEGQSNQSSCGPNAETHPTDRRLRRRCLTESLESPGLPSPTNSTCPGVLLKDPGSGPRGPLKGPRDPFKGPRGPFNGPRGPLPGSFKRTQGSFKRIPGSFKRAPGSF